MPPDPDQTLPFVLTPAEARVLGALIEKEVTTPEYYPLSLNALLNACNQRSNREPVMNLDEEAVRQALHGLEDLHLAGRARSSDGRVTKYEHWLGEAFNFSRAETALLCVLLLARSADSRRTARPHRAPTQLRGDRAMCWPRCKSSWSATPPLAAILPRQPGTKESRYAHLLSGGIDSIPVAAAEPAYARREAGEDACQAERIAQLELTVVELRKEMAALRQNIDDFLQMDRLRNAFFQNEIVQSCVQ